MPILEERILWFILSDISIGGFQIISKYFFLCNVYVYICGRSLKLITKHKDFTSFCYKYEEFFFI